MTRSHLIVLLLTLVLTLSTYAQSLPSIPGFSVVVYATDPMLQTSNSMCFAPDGTIYASNASYSTPLGIFRIAPGGGPGSVTSYGDLSWSPRSCVGYDVSGLVSGTAGSVLVCGGSRNPPYMAKILSDGTAVRLWLLESLNFGNPYDMAFDSTGRMLLSDVGTRTVCQSRGENPTVLFTCPTYPQNVAVDSADNIYVSCPEDRLLRFYKADGTELRPPIHTGYYGSRNIPIPIVVGKGGSWGDALYVLSADQLKRLEPSGVFTTVGTGFEVEHYADMEFGPDGALYILDYSCVRILRVTPRVYLEDDLGLPLDGQSIKVQPAYGGSWGPVFEGVTEGDGGLRCEMAPGYTKIRMTFNQASVEQTVAELTASGYTWTAVAATVKVVDHQGQGIEGVKVSQGGSTWVDHGYTDSAGELGLHLFPNKSYKFKVSGSAVSNSSQIAWFDVPGPIQFQTGYVVSAGAAIRGSIGGAWISYTSPGMHILPGTYSFVFSSPTPSPQSVVVTAGVQTDIP